MRNLVSTEKPSLLETAYDFTIRCLACQTTVSLHHPLISRFAFSSLFSYLLAVVVSGYLSPSHPHLRQWLSPNCNR